MVNIYWYKYEWKTFYFLTGLQEKLTFEKQNIYSSLINRLSKFNTITKKSINNLTSFEKALLNMLFPHGNFKKTNYKQIPIKYTNKFQLNIQINKKRIILVLDWLVDFRVG